MKPREPSCSAWGARDPGRASAPLELLRGVVDLAPRQLEDGGNRGGRVTRREPGVTATAERGRDVAWRRLLDGGWQRAEHHGELAFDRLGPARELGERRAVQLLVHFRQLAARACEAR